jgi:hypothetical protein
LYLWDVEKDLVTSYDFATEQIPGTEYGLIRKKEGQGKNAPQYRRYPSNVHWDPEDARLMALEVYLFQQKLDLTASMTADEKTYDLLLTSRGVGDGDSSIATAVTARDPSVANQEDMVSTREGTDLFKGKPVIAIQLKNASVCLFTRDCSKTRPKRLNFRCQSRYSDRFRT